MSLNPLGDESSISFLLIRTLIQLIRRTDHCSILRSQDLEHHGGVYSLTCLIMPQMIDLFRALNTCQSSTIHKFNYDATFQIHGRHS
jgi:hypothetical protein